MSEWQVPTATFVQERPAPAGYPSWPEYWKARAMPWRSEPEIGEERQHYLAQRRTIAVDVERSIYPFKDVRLTRADVEWLLATHTSRGQHGPVNWAEEKDKLNGERRQGLDLRGADLRGTEAAREVDLSGLPLALTQAGAEPPWRGRPFRDRIRLGVAYLHEARHAQTHFEGANLSNADLRGATLYHAHLEYATLNGALLEDATLSLAYLNHALFHNACLDGAELSLANLAAADLIGVRLELQGRSSDVLRPLDLRGATFDNHSALDTTCLVDGNGRGYAQVAYTDWGSANLALIDWAHVRMIGDECIARGRTTRSGRKTRETRHIEYEEATQANQRLAVVLRTQGLSEHADRFAYQAHLCQRRVYRYQRKHLQKFGSFLLYVISGYGYRPLRSFITYLLVIVAFALTYYLLGSFVNPPLDPLSAIVFSITSFHGRGFAPGENVLLSNPLTLIAAGEAIIGLLIEITFIATFTQRFFAR